ncbi:MAG: transposase, partial [Chlamydiota bacterium]
MKKKKNNKDKTPSFILELALRTSPKEEKELLSRFESARHLYNAVLREAKNRVMLVKQSKLTSKAKSLPKGKKQRNELFQEAKDKYRFSNYSLQAYAVKSRYTIANNLDTHTVQKLATRAFKATEKILYGTAKNVRFKGYNQINSVESKSNAAGIRWRNNQVEWNGLSLKPIIYIQDKVVEHGLKHRVKYCRILRKVIRGKNLFYVQLVLKGKPFIKEKNKMGKGTVCFDIGPSTIAIVSQDENNEFHARLLLFCAELEFKEKEIHSLQRKIDRQRRQSNPNNYLPNGKIKKGRHKWRKSNRQLENEKVLRNVHRRVVEHRKSLQGKLINETLRMGNVFKTENVSAKWLQKLYGRSVGKRAPGMFVSRLKRKAESAGGSFTKFPTQPTKLSQSCFCGRQHKKKLSERVHSCECGVTSQRDLFTGFLGLFVEEKAGKYSLQANQAKKFWPSADTLLQAAWREAV